MAARSSTSKTSKIVSVGRLRWAPLSKSAKKEKEVSGPHDPADFKSRYIESRFRFRLVHRHRDNLSLYHLDAEDKLSASKSAKLAKKEVGGPEDPADFNLGNKLFGQTRAVLGVGLFAGIENI